MDCKARVLTYWPSLDRLARLRFADSNLADQGLLYVMEQLAAEDWKRVRGFGGKASFGRYVSCLAARLLEDFARQTFGRPRPPTWLQRLGPLWETMYRRLCLERVPVIEAVEVVLQSGPGLRSREAVEEVAYTILARIRNCGERVGEAQPMDEEQERALANDGYGSQPAGETELVNRQCQEALEVVLQTLLQLDPVGGKGPALSEDFCQRLAVAMAIPLQPEERLLLRLVYQDGLKVSAAARLLAWTPGRAHGRLQTILATLRSRLEEAGLAGELNVLLERET
jgi:hypothetical protein